MSQETDPRLFNNYTDGPVHESCKHEFAVDLQLLTIPRTQEMIKTSRLRGQNCPVLHAKIQKFDGTAMHYLVFACQFKVHVVSKVDKCELFPLLNQNCEPDMQQKLNHLFNQLPATGFQLIWDLLYDEYGHLHKITCCCEESLTSILKILNDDGEKLKSLLNLLERCCILLEDIGQV